MKAYRICLVAFLLLFGGFVTAFGRDYPVKPFKVLHIEGVMKVVLDQGSKVALRMEANDDEAAKSFEFKQEADHVYLSTASKTNWSGKKNLVIYLTLQTLESIYFEGVGSVECARQLILPSLQVKAEGVGSMNLWVKSNNVTASMEGMGKLKLKGEARQANLSMEGTGKLDAFELKAAEVKVKLDGVGKAEVYCTEKLVASNDGIGSIRYRGNPKSVDKTNSGMGSIKPDQD